MPDTLALNIVPRPRDGWWRDQEPLVALLAAAGSPGDGQTFTMPMVVAEGQRVEDGRMFVPGGLTARSLPLPVMATWTTDEGHDGAVLVGILTSLTRGVTGEWVGSGVFDTSPVAMETARLVGNGMLNGVSVDVSSNDVTMTIPADAMDMTENADGSITIPLAGELIDFQTAQIIGVTICTMPAFANARIVLDSPAPSVESIAASVEGCEPCEAALTATRLRPVQAAAVATEAPPAEWFQNPNLDGPTCLRVEASGQVFGHLALWGVCHRGINDACVMAPRSQSNYAQFKKFDSVLLDDGTMAATGPLTVGTGHASLAADARTAAAHYDNTGSAVADVSIYEDEFGIAVAGAVRPGSTPEQVYALRASSLSGDWRPFGNSLELVAALAVNVEGFAVTPYALAASAAPKLGWREKDGEIVALVAAGSSQLAAMKTPVTRAEFDKLNANVRSLLAESLLARL